MVNLIDAGGRGGTYARGVVAQARAAILPEVRRLIEESVGRVAVRAGGNLAAIGIRSALMFDPAATAVVDDPDHEQVIVPLAGAHACCCCLPHLRTLPGLVSLWALDEETIGTAIDTGPLYPSGNDAAHTGSSVDEAAGVAAVTCEGRAYRYGANNAYHTAADAASLSLTGPLTLLCWVRVTYDDVEEGFAGKGAAYTFGKLGSGGLSGAPGTANRAYMNIIKNSTTTSVVGVGTTVLSAGSTYFLAGVYDGTNILLYVNGTLESTTACAIAPEDTAGAFTIGRDPYSASNSWSAIDNVAVVGRALSAVEVEILHNACLAG
jgi:hypothetical protein